VVRSAEARPREEIAVVSVPSLIIDLVKVYAGTDEDHLELSVSFRGVLVRVWMREENVRR
jgi:hypothetical protein